MRAFKSVRILRTHLFVLDFCLMDTDVGSRPENSHQPENDETPIRLQAGEGLHLGGLFKIGGEGRNRTDAWGFCRARPYHLATPP